MKRADIEKRLERLIELGGGKLTPASVVSDASDPASPLHSCFEWDDSVAAHKYRLEQARVLIRSVKCVSVIDHRRISAVAYVHDPTTPDKAGYVKTESLSERERAVAAINLEFERVASSLRRCKSIAAVLELESELESLLEGVSSISSKISGAA